MKKNSILFTGSRYNLFNNIHKGLRGMLYDAAICLQLADFSIYEEGAAAIEKLELLLSILDIHASDEERFIHPAVKRFDASVEAKFSAEQQKNCMKASELRTLFDDYQASQKLLKREETGETIFHTYNQFIAIQLMHMNCQEIELNDLLWKHYSDDELTEINKQILSALPADVNYIESNWMLKCNSNREIVSWLATIKDHAPHFVFDSILDLAERVLTEKRWQKIRESLCEGVMVDAL